LMGKKSIFFNKLVNNSAALTGGVTKTMLRAIYKGVSVFR